MFWADSLGTEYVYKRLDAWSKDYGEFFRPCEYLAARARRGASLVSSIARFIHVVGAALRSISNGTFSCHSTEFYADSIT
jgi:hypothetical protein